MKPESDEFFFTDLPQIDELTFRHFEGEADYPKMIEVLQESKDTDQIEEIDTLEVLTAQYAHLNNCDPSEDMLFVEIAGKVAGFTRVYWEDVTQSGRLYVHESYLTPKWRGMGIENIMLRFNEERLSDIAANHDKGQPNFFQVEAMSTQVDKIRLLLNMGYKAVRYFSEMVRPDLEDIPQCPLPPGLEIRPAKPDHYRAIWEANNEAMSDHWDHVDYSEEDYQFWLEGDEEFQPELWKIAWDSQSNQIAGMVLGFIDEKQNEKFDRKRGWPEDICVLRQWRRRGLAHALITETLREFKTRGMQEAAMYADTKNPSGAFQLYTNLGFQPRQTKIVFQKPLMGSPQPSTP